MNLKGMQYRSILYLMILLVISSCKKPENPPEGESIDFKDCLVKGSDVTLDIMTINLQLFPLDGGYTIDAVSQMIDQVDADIVALQELTNEASYNQLVEKLTGWSGVYYPIDNADWNLGYIYKNSEIELIEDQTRIIFTNDFYAFPRPPFEVHFRHNSFSETIILLNQHLKCCGGQDNVSRRRDASEKLYEYVAVTYPENPVIILGDLNDEISGDSEETNPFHIFIEDEENWLFADMDIALGSPVWWSYPSYPSHIDHILVSDEIAEFIDTTVVLRIDACLTEYRSRISDHRPVMTSFGF